MDEDTIERSAVDLTLRGVASLNVEYRRVGAGGGGEDSVTDVAAAIAAALALEEIDGERWAVAGHSAGAQLALAAVDRLRSTTTPRLAASLGGVLDLRRGIAEDLGDGAVRAYVATADADDLSPIALRPFGAPILLAHGRKDEEVGVSYAEAFAQSNMDLAAGQEPQPQAGPPVAPDPVELLVHGGGHYEYLNPADPAWTAVADRLVAALD